MAAPGPLYVNPRLDFGHLNLTVQVSRPEHVVALATQESHNVGVLLKLIDFHNSANERVLAAMTGATPASLGWTATPDGVRTSIFYTRYVEETVFNNDATLFTFLMEDVFHRLTPLRLRLKAAADGPKRARVEVIFVRLLKAKCPAQVKEESQPAAAAADSKEDRQADVEESSAEAKQLPHLLPLSDDEASPASWSSALITALTKGDVDHAVNDLADDDGNIQEETHKALQSLLVFVVQLKEALRLRAGHGQ